jgi:flagellar biosynthesis/type III secretory pathway protein FliH
MPSSEPPQSGGVLNPPANKKLTLEESVKTAIKYCIENNVLKQFLKEHGSEVFNMLTEEPSIEEIINIRVEEAIEDALEEAVQRVVKEAVNEAVKEAVEEGLEKGLEKGRAEIFNLLDQGLSVEEIKQRLSYSPA